MKAKLNLHAIFGALLAIETLGSLIFYVLSRGCQSCNIAYGLLHPFGYRVRVRV